jgi:hypothetical protein
MPEEEVDVEQIKQALVSSGVLKSTHLGEAEHKKLQEALSSSSARPVSGARIICSRTHYCIVVKD